MPWQVIIPAVLGAVGAGIQYTSASNAAEQTETLALLNAQAQRQSIEQTGQINQMQASLNEALRRKDQDAANANADAITRQAEIGTRASVENIRRSRKEAAEFAAQQVASLAKGGFADTSGSPLMLLADTAEKSQMTADALRYEDEQARRNAAMSATQARNQGILAGLSAGQQRLSGLAAQQTATRDLAQSRLGYYAQRANAGAMRAGAVGNLINSAGGIAYRGWSTYNDIY